MYQTCSVGGVLGLRTGHVEVFLHAVARCLKLCDWRSFPSNFVGLHLHTVVRIWHWNELKPLRDPGASIPASVSVQSFPPRAIRGSDTSAIIQHASNPTPATFSTDDLSVRCFCCATAGVWMRLCSLNKRPIVTWLKPMMWNRSWNNVCGFQRD